MAVTPATERGSEPSVPAPAGPPSRWTAGRIALLVIGSVVALLGLSAIVTGAYGVWLHTTQRSGGYVMTSGERFTTDGYALATRTLHISSDVPSFLYGRDWLGDVRIRGESADPGRPVFIGIAPKADVDRYLAGVAHSEVTDVNANPFGTTYRPSYRARFGGKPAMAPTRATFWVARASGLGTQTLSWSVRSGRWAVVVMRPDGARGVSADLAAGAKLPALLWASLGLLAFGLLVAAGGTAMILVGGRERRSPVAPAQ